MSEATSDATLDEIGFDHEVLAGSSRRVFAYVTKQAEVGGFDGEEEDEIGPGWFAVARQASVMLGDHDGEDVTLTFTALGDMLRRAFARAADDDPECVAFEALPRRTQTAWRAVARHLLNVYSFDEKMIGDLQRHEATIAEWGLSQPDS